MSPKRTPEFGAAYGFDEVAGFYDHDDTLVSFVIVKGPRILALRLRADYHPEFLAAPAQVWVTELPADACAWGDTLAGGAARVPVFLRRQRHQHYTFVGDYVALPRAATNTELANARTGVPHAQGVSRIVFMKRVA